MVTVPSFLLCVCFKAYKRIIKLLKIIEFRRLRTLFRQYSQIGSSQEYNLRFYDDNPNPRNSEWKLV